ncbi:hypothetical protein [Chryseobacterium sp. W4I1]|uniref:hypothetical protein n=1 Tax=Chryseobacterium sp. W4I1 TaxID=3042293 RepID=UPI002788260C|nr:hypothetical protein [Chryseobacterium sp. W4I1]MDQ0781692.1 hypothetical protein [Chryseobacterium sp. W4I1]
MEQIKRKAFIYILLLCFAGNAKAQILEFYEPIIVTYKSGMLNNEKIDLGIFDYFQDDTSKMKYEYLKYNSDKEILSKYDSDNMTFQTILCLSTPNFKSKQEIKLGMFDGFVLTRENSGSFIATSPYGNGRYPSHHKIIKSIDVLQKTKKTLIIRVNYQDEFEWKYFGILVLKDYKYENLEDEE